MITEREKSIDLLIRQGRKHAEGFQEIYPHIPLEIMFVLQDFLMDLFPDDPKLLEDWEIKQSIEKQDIIFTTIDEWFSLRLKHQKEIIRQKFEINRQFHALASEYLSLKPDNETVITIGDQ
jgi:hypothetical protein